MVNTSLTAIKMRPIRDTQRDSNDLPPGAWWICPGIRKVSRRDNSVFEFHRMGIVCTDPTDTNHRGSPVDAPITPQRAVPAGNQPDSRIGPIFQMAKIWGFIHVWLLADCFAIGYGQRKGNFLYLLKNTCIFSVKL